MKIKILLITFVIAFVSSITVLCSLKYLKLNTQHNINTLPSMSNFNNAYEQPYPIIEKLDYSNKNNVLHNNIGPRVLDEHIVEYRVIIDSQDRDIKVYQFGKVILTGYKIHNVGVIDP